MAPTYRKRLNRRRVIAWTCAFVVISLLLIVFNPRLQTHFVNTRLSKQIDSLTVGRIWLLPWSLSASKIEIEHDGIRFEADSMALRFGLWRLLFDVLAVSRMELHGFVLDLSDMPPSPPPTQPFAGIFPALQGLPGLQLSAVDVDGNIRIDPDIAIRLTIDGGTLKPDSDGTIDFSVTAQRASDDSRADSAGTLSIAQSEDRGITGLGLNTMFELSSPQLPHDEIVALTFKAAPVRANVTPATNDQATIVAPISSEHYVLTMSKPGPDDDLLAVTTNATLTMAGHRLAGNYTIRSHGGLITDYAPTLVLPDIVQEASGQFALALTDGTLVADWDGAIHLSALDLVLGDNPALPSHLRSRQRFSLHLSAGTLTIESAAVDAEHPGAEPVFNFALSAPLAIPLDAPADMLIPAREVGTLSINALPLPWLNGLLAEPLLSDGQFSMAFVAGTRDGAATLTASGPATATDVVLAGDRALPEKLALAAMPALRWHSGKLRITLDQVAIKHGDTTLASATLAASLAPDKPLGLAFTAHAAIDAIATLPPVAAELHEHPLPAALLLDLSGDMRQSPQALEVRKFDARLSREGAAPLLRAAALQPFSVGLGNTTELRPPEGELAVLAIDNFNLGWLEPLLTDIEIGGRLAAAEFALTMRADGSLTVRPRRALALSNVDISKAATAIVRNLSLRVTPDIDYSPSTLAVRYRDLDARIGSTPLLAGRGSVDLGFDNSGAGQPHLRGDLTLELAALRELPPLAEHFAAIAPRRRWQLDARYDITGDASLVTIADLELNVDVDETRYVAFRSASPLTLKPQIGADEELAQHLTGRAEARVSALPSAVLADIFALPAISFSGISVAAALHSDGKSLHARLIDELALDGVSISGEKGPQVMPFSVRAAAALDLDARALEVELNALSLTFDAAPKRPALAGQMSFRIEPDASIPLRTLTAQLTGYLPPLLQQPVLLPGHKLSDGEFTLTTTVAEDAAITIDAALNKLAATTPLAIETFTARADGHMAADGRGFRFTMPVTGSGRSGTTDGLLQADYKPAADAGLKLEFTSAKFLLNDVLATLDSISPAVPASAAATTSGDSGQRTPDRRADERALWDALPYAATLAYRIDSLYYTDYVIFSDVIGTLEITPELLRFASLRTRFHDSPIELDGTLAFDRSRAAEPYDLNVRGTVEEFDLNQFFTELVPGSKPRIEGLFGVTFDGRGRTPNVGEFRNDLLFDLELTSRAGLFRPLPPDSGLMASASEVLGIVGESLSYLPTGGFGAGAVSRLVDYIQEIDYDRIRIDITRDESRDLSLREFIVQSPTISMHANGGIDYVDGKDILDSPLTLDAGLNMSGKGAAILYSLNLLEDAQDEYGYHKGPTFRIRGTPAAAESNFAEIVTAAADGAVKGGVTRPISGLLGNIKYRWFGDEPQIPAPPEAATTRASNGAGVERENEERARSP